MSAIYFARPYYRLTEPKKFKLGHGLFLIGKNMTGQRNFRQVHLARVLLVKMLKTSKAANNRPAKYL